MSAPGPFLPPGAGDRLVRLFWWLVLVVVLVGLLLFAAFTAQAAPCWPGGPHAC